MCDMYSIIKKIDKTSIHIKTKKHNNLQANKKKLIPQQLFFLHTLNQTRTNQVDLFQGIH